MALSGDWMNAALTFSHSVGSMKFFGGRKLIFLSVVIRER